MLPQPAGLKDGIDNITPFEFFGEEGDVVLWHGRMYHSATPNYSDQIRQMILYDVMKKSVHDRAYRYYTRGPNASPPPSIRAHYDLPLSFGPLPAVPVAEPRAEGAGLWYVPRNSKSGHQLIQTTRLVC